MKPLPIHLTLACMVCALMFTMCTGEKPQNERAIIDRAKSCIESVIAKDDSLGAVRNHACEKIPLAATIAQYADGMEKLDFSACPEDFKLAFSNHIAAWRNMIPIVEKHPGLRGEMHDLFEELENGEDAETFKPLMKAIWDTWGAVELAMKEE